MTVLTRDALGDRDAFVLGLVREHRATHDVADRPDAGQVGFAIGVGDDESALVQCEPHFGGVESGRMRHATNRHDELVEAHGLRLAVRVGIVDQDILARGDLGDVHAETDREALFCEQFRGFLRDLLVGRTEQRRQCFEHRHVRAEAPPDTAHFQPDDARTDDAETLGHVRQRERAFVVEDALVVERRARQSASFRTAARLEDFQSEGTRWLIRLLHRPMQRSCTSIHAKPPI